MAPPPSSRIAFANTLRGLAVMTVLLHHYFLIFFKSRGLVATLTNAPALSYTDVPVPALINHLDFYPFFDWGAFGVALFFLISGFVIPFSLQQSSWRTFLLNRFFRIVPIYVVGFSITLLAIVISGRYFHLGFPYPLKAILVHYVPGLRDLLRSTNIDGIVWTLEIEIKFYFLCVLLCPLFKKNRYEVFYVPWLMGLVAYVFNILLAKKLALSHVLLHFLSLFTFVAQYLIFIFIGVVFNYCYRQRASRKKGAFYIATYFLLFLLISYTGIYRATFPLALSYAFAVLVFSFAYFNQHFFGDHRAFNFFAAISYPLYVVHGVTGMVLLHILLIMHYSIMLSLMMTVLTVIFIATLLHYYIEKPLQALAKRPSNARPTVMPALENA